jgi:hypothetical protein
MALTALPPAPNPNNPTTFAALADAFVAALANMVTEINTQGSTPVGITPCFSAVPSAVLTLTSGGALVKLPCPTEIYDVGNCYDGATNIRFAPTVAGKYRIAANVGFTGTTVTRAMVSLYKNGAQFTQSEVACTGASGSTGLEVDVVANGTTDYFELFVGATGTGTVQARALAGGTLFSGSFISP